MWSHGHKGLLLADVKPDIHWDTEGPLYKAALQRVSPQCASMPDIITPQLQSFGLPFIELHGVPTGPLFQPAVVPLDGNTTNWHIIVLPDASPLGWKLLITLFKVLFLPSTRSLMKRLKQYQPLINPGVHYYWLAPRQLIRILWVQFSVHLSAHSPSQCFILCQWVFYGIQCQKPL